MKKTKKTIRLVTSLCATAITAHGSVLIPVDAAAFDRGSGAANGTGVGGLLQTTTLELGLTKNDPNDPSTWTTARHWNYDFQGQDLSSLTSLPWMAFDLGADYSNLDLMHVINVSEATGWQRGVKTFNLWYSTTATVPVWASAGSLTDGAANVVNYTFSGANGWTQLSTGLNLDRGAENEGGTDINPIDGTFDLSGISSARYIGIEITSSYWDDGGANPFGTITGSNSRVGINQIAFTTAIPEPSVALLGAVGLLGLFRRRR